MKNSHLLCTLAASVGADGGWLVCESSGDIPAAAGPHSLKTVSHLSG